MLSHFITYILRHLTAALLPGTYKPSIVTYKPVYTVQQRRAVALELIPIGLMQLGIWYLCGGNWLHYLFAVVVPLLVASAVTMTYIWTNHRLKPLFPHSEPLLGSTSVIVPRGMNWLHDNFSYHTEHHIFPGMNPRYYPEVSRLLATHFPDRYHRIPLHEAWQRL